MKGQVDVERERRLRFLLKLYEVTGGNELVIPNMFTLGEELGLDREATSRIVQYLRGEGFLGLATMGGGTGISHFGVVEAERALTHPAESSDYFPALNIIHVETMVNSTIQQGTANSTQAVSSTAAPLDAQAIGAFLSELKASLSSLGLDGDALQEARADVATIEAQLQAPKPKMAILREAGRSLRALLEGATGSVIGAELLQHWAAVAHWFS